MLLSWLHPFQWAKEAVQTMKEARSTSSAQKKMLKKLLQDSTNKAYEKTTGQKYFWPDDTLWVKDKPTVKWNYLYWQMKDKYKNLK